jgi:hypothetical protein
MTRQLRWQQYAKQISQSIPHKNGVDDVLVRRVGRIRLFARRIRTLAIVVGVRGFPTRCRRVRALFPHINTINTHTSLVDPASLSSLRLYSYPFIPHP